MNPQDTTAETCLNVNKLVQFFAMARAAVTGRSPREIGEHGEVRMR